MGNASISKVSLKTILALPLLFGLVISFVGRYPVEGTVIVSGRHVHRVEAVLVGSGVSDWTVDSNTEATLFRFPDASQLKRVECRIANNAVEDGFQVEIQYRTLLPAFRSCRS